MCFIRITNTMSFCGADIARRWNRQRILEAINAEGVPCFVGSCSEIYLEKAFLEPMRPAHRLTVARDLGETSLMFLVHPTLTEARHARHG